MAKMIKKAQDGIKQDSVKTKNDSILVKQRKTNLDALNKISDDFAKKQLEKTKLKLYDNTKKKKMKNGGSLSGLTASTKRDKGTDVGGAWTKVQNKTLAGAKGKASLTKDKQLGATKMAKRGMSIKKK
jgi:hypothetical protein